MSVRSVLCACDRSMEGGREGADGPTGRREAEGGNTYVRSLYLQVLTYCTVCTGTLLPSCLSVYLSVVSEGS